MLWPIVLPLQITLAIMTAVVVAATIVAASLKSKPGVVFWLVPGIAFVALIPSCAGIMSILDARRFGVFQCASYKDVQDFRIERYLPPAATKITLEKPPMGHRAKYTITEANQKAFLDEMWTADGKCSAVSREDLMDGTPASPSDFELQFAGLNLPPLQNAVRYSSIAQSDDGGATYYFESATGTCYHRAGYW